MNFFRDLPFSLEMSPLCLKHILFCLRSHGDLYHLLFVPDYVARIQLGWVNLPVDLCETQMKVSFCWGEKHVCAFISVCVYEWVRMCVCVCVCVWKKEWLSAYECKYVCVYIKFWPISFRQTRTIWVILWALSQVFARKKADHAWNGFILQLEIMLRWKTGSNIRI